MTMPAAVQTILISGANGLDVAGDLLGSVMLPVDAVVLAGAMASVTADRRLGRIRGGVCGVGSIVGIDGVDGGVGLAHPSGERRVM